MKKISQLTSSKSTIVGADLAEVLPQSSTSWVKQPHLLRLNGLLLVVFLSSVTLGFDGSMMNGLLSLESWNKQFGTPRSGILGLTNAVLPLGVVCHHMPLRVLPYDADL